MRAGGAERALSGRPAGRDDSPARIPGMASFAAALRALNQMKDAAIIEEYAIAGAMAVVFRSKTIATGAVTRDCPE